MRFIVDENAGPAVARWLKSLGHEVFSVYHEAQGISDEAIIHKAYQEQWILITGDKDFGEKVYREQFPHHGIILLRLHDERSSVKIETLRRLFGQYEASLSNNFIVVSENRVRFARPR